MAAAVADFTPSEPSGKKLKKGSGNMTLLLNPTADILSEIGKNKADGQIVAGFALETDDEETNARYKMAAKNLDLIVLNSLKDPGAGFKSVTNKVSIFTRDGKELHLPLKSKEEVARDIIDVIGTII
jgi:phosphopantothenoylcysteine decarboxylase/phosphopantothenate--cysteine ligase